MRAAFGQAMRWGWISDNPAERAHRIVTNPAELRPPTPQELRVLLDYIVAISVVGADHVRCGRDDGVALELCRPRTEAYGRR